jgi:hypothetical protein
MNFFSDCLDAIVRFFCEILFGCSHNRLTRPFTIGDETYEVCLDCGKQIYYSAREMRPLTLGEVRRMKAAHAGEVKMMPVPSVVPKRVRAGNRKPHVAA